jgi:hypothetical protein
MAAVYLDEPDVFVRRGIYPRGVSDRRDDRLIGVLTCPHFPLHG